MSPSAIAEVRDGYTIITHTDVVIHVTAELWQELVEGTPTAKPEMGQAVVDVDGGTLTLGTAGKGLGRINYRYVGRMTGRRVYVYERIS